MKALKKKAGSSVSYFQSKLSSRRGIIFVAAFAVIGGYLLFRSFAAAPEIYLKPAANSVTPGSNFTVELRVNPGRSIDGVESTITYDQAKLQYVSIDSSTSAFPIPLVETGGSGTVQITRGIFAPSVVNSDSLVAKVTFKALASASGSSTLQLAGNATFQGNYINPAKINATVNITGSSTLTATYTLEPSTSTPVAGTAFNLKVYIDTNANMAGGEVKVNLPTGVTYGGTLDTTGSPFNPVQTVTGTTSQLVYIVFATQSRTLTGKQLVATIPVTSATIGAKTITISGQRLVDINDVELSGVGGPSLNITVNNPLNKPIISIPGKPAIGASEQVTNLNLEYTITNFDATATYAVTIGGVPANFTSGKFKIPTSLVNGDHQLKVLVTKGSSTNEATHTILLRNPNVNRNGCIELRDLLAVNKVYGTSTKEYDLNFDNTVSLLDLLTITSKWGTECL